MNIGIVIGIALAVAITTIRNERMVREYKKKQELENLKKTVKLEVKPAQLEKVEKQKKEIHKK